MLTKEECLSALENMAFVEGFMNLEHMLNYDCAIALKYKVIHQLIEEHFDMNTTCTVHADNPPLNILEIHNGMIIWDDEQQEYIRIKEFYGEYTFERFGEESLEDFEYEEGRYFRKKVEE